MHYEYHDGKRDYLQSLEGVIRNKKQSFKKVIPVRSMHQCAQSTLFSNFEFHQHDPFFGCSKRIMARMER